MKVILVVLDGLSYQVAAHAMGYLLAECHAGKGHIRQISSALPSMSRPLYETILTGKTPVESGITHNYVTRLSREKSIFHYAKNLKKTTAAAASHWFGELYNKSPYDFIHDRFVNDPSLPIQHGIFYFDETYPDSHTLADGEYLRKTYNPDFLLIHPSFIDTSGHLYGGDSKEYRNAARIADEALAYHLPQWLDEGYQVWVTADHGSNADASHGGNLPEETQVPLFIFGSEHINLQNQAIQQTDICSVICQLLEA